MNKAKAQIPAESITSWSVLRQSFLDGLRGPSVIGTLGAVVIALGQLALACVVITPANLARMDSGYMLDNPYDVFTHSTFQIHRMRYTESGQRGVLLVGSSTLREAMVDDQMMQTALSRSLGEPISFFRIPSGWQSLWETVAVVDHLPEGFNGVIVVGVDPGRMGRSAQLLEQWVETPLLAIDSPHFREEMKIAGVKPPKRTGVFLVDHAEFFSARKFLPLRLVGGPIEAQTHFAHLAEPWSEEKWKRVENRELPLWISGFETNGQSNLDLLERLIRRVRGNGSRLVLLETPLHPRARRACGKAYDEYLREMQRFADAWQVPFWRLDAEAQIKEEDFADFVHLGDHAAQLRYQTVLMNKLEPMLREQREKES